MQKTLHFFLHICALRVCAFIRGSAVPTCCGRGLLKGTPLSAAEETNLRKAEVTLPENVLLSIWASGHTRGGRTTPSLDGAEGGAKHVGLVPAPEGARVVALRRSATPLGATVAEPAEKVRLALEVGEGLKW